MATEIQRRPETVEAWQDQQRRQRLQIAQLDTQKVARRAAELIAMLETASAKIDRFGWASMDKSLKDALCNDWCDILSQYTLDEVRAGIGAVFAASGGKLRSINEYQVQEQILREHRRIAASLPREELAEPRHETAPEERERAARYIAERFPGTVKRMETET